MKDIMLEIVPGRFAICRLEPDARTPIEEWSFAARTPEELSLVCLEENIPKGAVRAERGYACMRVSGVLDLSLTGVLAEIADVLAKARIPVFAVSTFDTDYVFIESGRLQSAVEEFRKSGLPVA